ncbi:unnamed protein product [Paramecium sonneborni]|uniref:Transmembrane protein n=1 Tax=Paramecium sonneborni TaxID=65129 RepID=A0A8S1RQM3_9CILI|nr:unnamed protein product [Paramecium sonneborni]
MKQKENQILLLMNEIQNQNYLFYFLIDNYLITNKLDQAIGFATYFNTLYISILYTFCKYYEKNIIKIDFLNLNGVYQFQQIYIFN